MYIKYKLANRNGWNRIMDVDEAEAQHLMLREGELDNWITSCRTECDSISYDANKGEHIFNVDVLEKNQDLDFTDASRSDMRAHYGFINVKKKDGSSILIFLDTEAFLCGDNGETAERLT